MLFLPQALDKLGLALCLRLPLAIRLLGVKRQFAIHYLANSAKFERGDKEQTCRTLPLSSY
jgi:hypothetical protein